MIVAAIPETACASDANAVQPMLEQRQSHELLPAEPTAGTAYSGDENRVFAESLGVELIAPIPGKAPQIDPDALTLDHFAHHEVTGSVEACPAGHTPLRVARAEPTQTGDGPRTAHQPSVGRAAATARTERTTEERLGERGSRQYERPPGRAR